ncbi:MAG: hypothetical protein QG597_1320, partial [Actinomycetota bacterium]|nr:hypothetical protein [Actinomycetota bacterium]
PSVLFVEVTVPLTFPLTL